MWRAQDVVEQEVERLHERLDQPYPCRGVAPERGPGVLPRADDCRGAIVERVREREGWLDELEAVPVQRQRAEERRRRGERHDAGADVVAITGERKLVGTRPAAYRLRRLEHPDGATGARERDGRREPVRPGAHDDRVE